MTHLKEFRSFETSLYTSSPNGRMINELMNECVEGGRGPIQKTVQKTHDNFTAYQGFGPRNLQGC